MDAFLGMGISALLVGDIWLSPELYSKRSALEESMKLLQFNRQYDLFIGNLEAPIRGTVKRKDRRAILETDKRLLKSLKLADMTIMSLANNHLNDYGEEGLLATIEECRNNGIYTVGAGKNLQDAQEPLIVKIKGVKIAVLAYADTRAYVGGVAATNNAAGIAPLELTSVVSAIKRVRSDVDMVLLFLHWGEEYVRYPSPEMRMMARKFIEAGVSLIVGHHPHVLMGYECYKNVDIYYSLGNTIFPNIVLQDGAILKWSQRSRKSMVVEVELDASICKSKQKLIRLDNIGLPTPEVKENKAQKKYKRINNIMHSNYYDYIYPCYNLNDKISMKLLNLLKRKRIIKEIIRLTCTKR